MIEKNLEVIKALEEEKVRDSIEEAEDEDE